MIIIKNESLNHLLSIRKSTGEKLSYQAEITTELSRKISMHHLILEPQKRSSPPHAHSHIEEIFYILEGEITLKTPEKKTILHKGDSAIFPTGDETAHSLYNHSENTAEILQIQSIEAHDKVTLA